MLDWMINELRYAVVMSINDGNAMSAYVYARMLGRVALTKMAMREAALSLTVFVVKDVDDTRPCPCDPDCSCYVLSGHPCPLGHEPIRCREEENE